MQPTPPETEANPADRLNLPIKYLMSTKREPAVGSEWNGDDPTRLLRV